MTDKILDLLDESKANASKKFKLGLLMDNDSELLRQVCLAAYDPYTTYGMNKLPDCVPALYGDGEEFNEGTWGLLDLMASRKLTGNEAKDYVVAEMSRLTAKSAQLLGRIIKKDLRAGFSESTINKAYKKLIPTFPYMRCSLAKDAKFDEWDWKVGAISQEKADGMFTNINNEEGGVVMLTSRQGTLMPAEAFPDIVSEMQSRMTKGMQYHGEILVSRRGKILPREEGNGVINHVVSGGDFSEGDKPIYLMWDAIPLEHVQPKGRYNVEYTKRLRGMVKDLRDEFGYALQLIRTKVFHSLKEAYGDYAEYLQAGKEGTVIKNPNGFWRDGTSKDQIKLKLQVDVDLKVVAIVPGKVGTKVEGRAGALTCVTSEGDLVVDVTVKNETMRDHVDANPDEWLESIIVVRFNQITKPSKSNSNHSLFLPRMVEAAYRTDKDEADSLELVFDQFESAIAGA
ncbi:MAG: DNA ligase [Piscirickettsiaceae bacterium]|nr:DNA ligase [Piscirickettsiaceae bacterium]